MEFSKIYPGLVGGHCISVDPYYLTYVAKLNNYNPKVILAGRKINNHMKLEVVKKFLTTSNFMLLLIFLPASIIFGLYLFNFAA